MNTLKLIISSPDGEILSCEVLKIMLRGANGDLAIMAGHTPFITTAKKGVCKITFADSTEKTAEIDGGLLTAEKEKVVLLTGTFKWKTDSLA